MHKEPKVILRVYLTPDERDALKQIAEEQNSSLSELIATATRKQYKLGKKKKVRQVNASLLEDATMQNSEVANTHTVEAGFDLSVDGEQVSLDEPSLTSSTAVDDVVLESVETHSSDVEITVTPEVDTTAPEVVDSLLDVAELLSRDCQPWEYTTEERDFMKNRITEINGIIDNAKASGNTLSKKQFRKLCNEKDQLKKIVYYNNVK